MAMSCEIKPPCLVWTTDQPKDNNNLRRSPPFFLKRQRCHLIFLRYSDTFTRLSLRIEADLEDQSNYRTSVSLERDGLTGLSTSGVFGHSHPSPQIIWEYTYCKIKHTFPRFNSSTSKPLTFELSFFSTTPGDDGKAMEPKLKRAQSKTEQTVKTSEMATTSLNLNADPCLEILSGDLSKLLDGDTHQDVEFKCEGGVVRAHSNLLSTRSRVLAAMLQCDMAEGRTGHVEIPDMEAELFRCFIRYLYTGKLPALTIDSARSLYEAGDKYEVMGLTRRCSQFLKQNLAPANACDLLVLAEAHSDQHFKEDVVAYILDNGIPLQDEHWQAFCDGHSRLATEVLNRFCKMHREILQPRKKLRLTEL